jgi:uncharacterized protein YcaQ
MTNVNDKRVNAAKTTHHPAPAASLPLSEARRIALAAQAFDRSRPSSSVTLGHLKRVVDRLGVLQIDSVNVLVRSHYLPLYSRLGIYERELLERAAYARSGRALFEYWGHEASFLPLKLQPLLRWRMERARQGIGTWKRVAQFLRERAAFIRDVLAELRERGPLGAGDIQQQPKKKAGWWAWSDTKVALECLFWAGEVTTATRRHFERIYDLTERVIPSEILQTPTPAPVDAQRELLAISARALGIATEADLRDYFRLSALDARHRVAELVESGALIPVQVEGWRPIAYLHQAASGPRRIEAQALLSPFDSLIWERARTERLFGCKIRLEIYTPAHQRTHGYYVLPFLLGDRIVARLDLKADRQRSQLNVIAAYLEADASEQAVVEPLANELDLMRKWLGLERIHIGRRGGLANSLRRISHVLGHR